jgi:hypothetical protein
MSTYCHESANVAGSHIISESMAPARGEQDRPDELIQLRAFRGETD